MESRYLFPNREALLDLFSEIADTPALEQHLLSHATIAPAVVAPLSIEKLTEVLLDKSPLHLSIQFTPLHDTRMEKKKGVIQTRKLTGLQCNSGEEPEGTARHH
ncbi:MAG: hypothetical protein AAB225_14350 [Acidobacteriota bacterium]